jgi:hypothetical protein
MRNRNENKVECAKSRQVCKRGNPMKKTEETVTQVWWKKSRGFSNATQSWGV